MPRCTPEYLRERGRVACTAGGHVEALRDAATEIERLEKLLKGRDEFIVNNGLWHEFVANLEAS